MVPTKPTVEVLEENATDRLKSLSDNPGIRLRAVLLGLALLPLNAFWVVDMEYIRYSAHPTTVSLFFNCIFELIVLNGLNKLVLRFRPSFALSQSELLLIYSMLCIGSCMCGHDFGQVLVSSLAWPFADSQHRQDYQRLLWHYLPKWAMAPDRAETAGFFQGNSTLYTRAHLIEWLPCLCVWTAFTGVLLWVMQCINVLIRKQWTDNERISYPLVKMPIELTATQPFGTGASSVPLLRSQIFWIGFALAAGIDIVNSLNYYYPSIPSILEMGSGQVYDLQKFVVNKPWNAIGWTPVTFYPFVIGLAYLLPMDFLFSAWFFYIVWKLEAVVVAAFAWDADPNMPYANYQALGAYLMYFVASLWLSGPYFKQVWRCAVGAQSSLDDRDEPMKYRSALIGLAVGMTLLVAFSIYVGMAWWLAVVFFLLYFAIALAITRMRAEMGTPVHDLHFTGPDWALSDYLAPHNLGPQNLTVFSMFFWFNRAYRCHPMPFQLEALKMAEQTGARREMRKWVAALMAAGIFGMVSAFWAILHFGYTLGTPNLFASAPWDRYTGWMTSNKPPNALVGYAAIGGFLIAGVMQVVRTTGLWCPFHPLAYAVSGSWEMNLLWMPLLIAWVAKGIVLRFGGGKSYSNALPFFYGLMLGQFIPGSLLNIWGLATNSPTYQFWQ